ncbi:MAG: RsiV family protein [Gammaproteobacteria bacterium]
MKNIKLLSLIGIAFLSTQAFADDPIKPVTKQLNLVKQSQHTENTQTHTVIDANFPLFNGTLDPASQQFNQTVVDLINKEINAFKKDAVEFNEMSKNGSPAIDLNSSLNIEYFTNTVQANNRTLISVRFSINQYLLGAAHPNESYRVLNYTLSTGKILTLADLFAPGSSYEKTLTSYCLKILSTRLKRPTSEIRPMMEFNNWNIRPDGLLFSFDQFPNAMADQTVIVPYAAIQSILAKNSDIYVCAINVGSCT